MTRIITMKCSISPAPQVVVLAAGYSSRLGRPKALACIRGISLLRRTVRLTAPFSAARPIVVVPPRAGKFQRELQGGVACFVGNRRRAVGLSSSVILGVRRARCSPAILLLPVDLACLTRRDLTRLVMKWRASRRRVAARRVDGRGAIPLVLPRWLYAAALGIAGDRGLQALIGSLPTQSVSLVDLPSAVFDVDTPGDLARARRPRRPLQGSQE